MEEQARSRAVDGAMTPRGFEYSIEDWKVLAALWRVTDLDEDAP